MVSVSMYEWFMVYTFKGVDIENNVFTSSTGDTFHRHQLFQDVPEDRRQRLNDMFFELSDALQKLNLTNTELGFMMSLVLFSTGKLTC